MTTTHPDSSNERGASGLRPLIILIAALIALMVAAVGIRLMDEPPPDISDLTPRSRMLKPEENAYIALNTVVSEFDSLTRADSEVNGAVQRVVNSATWSADDARFLELRLKTIWPRLRDVAALRDADAPLDALFGPGPRNDPLRSLCLVAISRARLLALDGEPNLALRELGQLLRTISLYANSGPLNADGFGTKRLRNLVLSAIRETASSHRCSVTTLLELAHELPGYSTTAEATAETQRRMFYRDERILRGPGSPQIPTGSSAINWVGPEWFYKPNQTTRWVAELARGYIAQLDDRSAAQIVDLDRDHGQPSIGIWPHPDNSLGRYYIRSSYPFPGGVLLLERMSDRTAISATQAFLALRAYHLEHAGTLPASLDELVPAYLPAVPRDYYSGQPIRYSRDFRAVWSVGRRGLVIERVDQTMHSDSEEIYYPFTFANPAKPATSASPGAK